MQNSIDIEMRSNFAASLAVVLPLASVWQFATFCAKVDFGWEVIMVTIGVKEGARLNFRLKPDVKERIEKAAAVAGKTLTEFAVTALANTAEEVLERYRVTKLSDRDRDIFLAVLDRSSKPNQALKRAAKTHKRLIIK